MRAHRARGGERARRRLLPDSRAPAATLLCVRSRRRRRCAGRVARCRRARVRAGTRASARRRRRAVPRRSWDSASAGRSRRASPGRRRGDRCDRGVRCRREASRACAGRGRAPARDARAARCEPDRRAAGLARCECAVGVREPEPVVDVERGGGCGLLARGTAAGSSRSRPPRPPSLHTRSATCAPASRSRATVAPAKNSTSSDARRSRGRVAGRREDGHGEGRRYRGIHRKPRRSVPPQPVTTRTVPLIRFSTFLGTGSCSGFRWMDFRDSEKEAAFRAEARAFLEANKPAKWQHPFDDNVDEHAAARRLGRPGSRRSIENGWGAIMWPQEFGGRGLGPIEADHLEPGARPARAGRVALRGRHRRWPGRRSSRTARPSRRRATSAAAARRRDLVSALQRARRRLGSGLARDARRARRRRLDRDRPEDLVLRRPLRRLRHPARAQRLRASRSTRASPTSCRHARARRRACGRCAR